MTDPLARVPVSPPREALDDSLFAPPKPIHVPAARGRAPIVGTSREAFASRRGAFCAIERTILALILEGPKTLDEIAEQIGKFPSSLSGRLLALEKRGLICRPGGTRRTRSGYSAKLWHATAAALDAAGGEATR